MKIRSKILLGLLLFAIISCSSFKKDKSRLYLSDDNIEIIDSAGVFDFRFEMKKYLKIELNKKVFYVSTFKDEEIDFLMTFDKEFITPDSIRIGDSYESIKDNSIFITYSMDYVVYELKSGWRAVINFKNFRDIKITADSSRVAWLEKYEE